MSNPGEELEEDDHIMDDAEDDDEEEEDSQERKDKLGDLFGNDEEEDSSSDFDMQQYRSVTDLDAYSLHRAAEDGDLPRLKESLERMTDKVERRDTWGLTPLHVAIIACQNIDCFEVLLNWPGTDVEAKCQGSPVPHVVLTVSSLASNAAFGLKALRLLIAKEGTLALLTESKDDYDRTPLRLACELGLEIEFIRLLLSVYEAIPDQDHRKQVLSCRDRIKKWNCLHAAADLQDAERRDEIMDELLRKGGFDDVVNDFDSCTRTCLHVLVRRTGSFEGKSCSMLLEAGVGANFKDVLGREASDYARPAKRTRRGPTIVYSHETCAKHFTCPEQDTIKPWYSRKDVPPENVNRLTVLLNERFGTLTARRLTMTHDRNPPKAELGDVLRVHDWGYVQRFREKCAELKGDEMGELDGDTTFSASTFDASLIACGSAIKAVDEVMSGGIL